MDAYNMGSMFTKIYNFVYPSNLHLKVLLGSQRQANGSTSALCASLTGLFVEVKLVKAST